MRIGQETLIRTIVRDVFLMHYDQVQTEKSISTNKIVNLPSDSPGFAATILDSRRALREIVQYNANLDAATSWLTASESAMDSMVERLNRARVVAEQMATGTYQSEEHESASAEIQNIIEQIITLANSRIEGSYIFGGTRTELPPINSLLVADNFASLAQDSGPGHGTLASIFEDPPLSGNYFFQMARDTTGAGATLVINPNNALNTLGDGLAGVDFDAANWTITQAALTNPPQGMILTNNSNLTGPADLVSNRVGETLYWTGDSTVGEQIFRTKGSVTFTAGAGGAATVRVSEVAGPGFTDFVVNGATAAESAQDLAEQINASGNDYYAWTEGTTVNIMARNGAADTYTISEPGAPSGVFTFSNDTTLQDMTDAFNNGTQATGMVHLVDGAANLPAATDTVTLGNFTWTWGEIAPGLDPTVNNADDYALALESFINANSDQFTAVRTTTATSNDASVIITARAPGMAGNVPLTATGGVLTSGELVGGMDGTDTDTPGHLFGSGTSNLRLNTLIKAEVIEVDSGTGAVTMRLRWFDDDNLPQTKDVVLGAAGEDNSVAVPELGDISLYRDDMDFHVGAVFNLDLTHYQGNEEDIALNFSQGTRMTYNWNARQLLGEGLRLDLRDESVSRTGGTGAGSVYLDGIFQGLQPRDITFDVVNGGTLPGGDGVTFRVTWTDDSGNEHVEELNIRGTGRNNGVVLPLMGTSPKVDLNGVSTAAGLANTGTGSITLSGTYTGLTPRDLNFEVINPGTAPDDNITVRATWVDDQGAQHQEDLVLQGTGADNAVELPGGDGISFYLEPGDYDLGDTFSHSFQMYPDNAGEGIFFYVDNQNFDVGDSFRYEIEKEPVHVLDTLIQWQYMLENGTLEESQTFSQRALEALDEALQSLTEYVAEAGTRQTRIEVRTSVLEEQNLYASDILEDLQEVDLVEAFMDLQAQQTAYSAALKVISVVTDMTLVNLL
ncbi:MAG: flagellin [Desulfarculaceae bacterium]|jgi:flagellar hook-associated protein 3 FlgL